MATLIAHAQGHVILQNGHTELLILDQYVKELQQKQEKKPFAEYFRSTALVNRNARRLFDSWVRKEPKLWSRLYDYIHNSMNDEDNAESTPSSTEQSADTTAAE
ncbi:MAG: hypothetical protein AB8C84_02600 [Oligoflexales bacterium]